jgi:hypothetical protein
MLRSFRVANHKSIRTEQELQLMPAYDKSRPVVPVVAIYGRNAAGKTNLLDALQFMQTAVRHSVGLWEARSGIPRSPFRLDRAAREEPSTFAVDLILDGVQYAYGFDVDDTQVLAEWLYAYRRTNRKTVIFERRKLRVTLGDSLAERTTRTKTLTRALRDNALLLGLAMQLGEQAEFVPVYEWFRTGLLIPRVGRAGPLSARLAQRIESVIDTPGFLDLVRSADMDIVDVRLEEVADLSIRKLLIPSTEDAHLVGEEAPAADGDEHEEQREKHEVRAFRTEDVRRAIHAMSRVLGEGSDRDVVFLQGENLVPMSIDDQSAGTVAYIDLIAYALDALGRGGTLLVDEIDMSLHPRLIARLIELFHDKKSNPRLAQLIFNTHDATLLGTSFGREILRRDEIWFVDKEAGATTLYALTDFHPRQEDNREKRYLGGSYGGVPSVFSDTLVDRLLESREGASGAAA